VKIAANPTQRVRRLVSGDFAAVFGGGGGGGGAGGKGSGSALFGGGGGGVDILLTPTAPTCAPLLHDTRWGCTNRIQLMPRSLTAPGSNPWTYWYSKVIKKPIRFQS
jgi:hypothetical protein